MEGSGTGQFMLPSGVAVDGSGNVFVVDTRNYRVQKFTNAGTFLTKWGSFGGGPGQFALPQGVAVDGSGNVFVTDTFNNFIAMFDNTDALLTAWDTSGGNPIGHALGGVAVDGSGNVFVYDSGPTSNRIEKFACPIPPPPPPVCGLVNGDPAAGTAICGGPCPLDFPFCAWVPGTVAGEGACRCVDNPCAPGVGGTCSGALCSSQRETCGATCLCE
jgi:hypothetical protein